MAPELGTFLHDEGYISPTGRRFKMWTFSNIHAKLVKDTRVNCFIVPTTFNVTVASSDKAVVESIVNNMFSDDNITINNVRVNVSASVKAKQNITSDTVIFRTLSPITEYSTLELPNGKKLTHYYCPMEEQFSELIFNNLNSKYHILNGEYSPEHVFKIFPAGKCREHIIVYKDTVIKAWSGTYKMIAHPKLIEVALNCGLGAKSSQGFGCIEIVDL